MNAGTLATLRPIADPLESWARSDDSVPCLDVRNTQTPLDGGAPVQEGAAASTVEVGRTHVGVTGTNIETTREKVNERVVTEWCADVTGAGIVAAESTVESGGPPFPFDLLTVVTGEEVQPVTIDTDALKDEWASADGLRETWMAGEKDGESTVMKYGPAARSTDGSNVGIGFKTDWNGTIVKGVVFASGYVSIYRDLGSGGFLSFVDDEIMPFAEPLGDAPGTQATL